MLIDSMTLEHFTPEDVQAARKLMLQLLRNDDAVGKWTHKTEVRQTGMTTHVKWENRQMVRLDGTGEANRFARILLMSGDSLFAILVKLFGVGDDEMDALLTEARLVDG